MKIRNGFVSNSSSSSFIIYGNEVSLSEVKIGKHEYCAIGREMNEGSDVIDIDSYEMLHALRLANKEYNIRVFEVSKSEVDGCIQDLLEVSDNEYWNMNDEEINEILKEKVPGFGVFLSKDYRSSESIEDIINMYYLDCTEEDIIKGSKQYYREKKLNRIINQPEI